MVVAVTPPVESAAYRYFGAARAIFRAPKPFVIRGRVESELGVESLVAEELELVV